MVALELEVLAKKYDRFGWERDTGSAVHDRLIMDWMDALQDYPLHEVRAACRAAVLASPGKMPNEGHVLAQIREARRDFLAINKPKSEPQRYFSVNSIPVKRRRKFANDVLAAVGFRPKRLSAGSVDE